MPHDPLTDPRPGDIVEIGPSLFRHVSARAPRSVWWHSRSGNHWSGGLMSESITDWKKSTAGGKVITCCDELPDI